MKIFLIRHGKTNGNLKKKYIGKTDESILDFAIKKPYPKVEAVFASGLKRTKETAKKIYPSLEPIQIEKLNECDFGDFEGKSYEELKEDQSYIDYISSNGNATPPNGENINAFKERSCQGFILAVEKAREIGAETIAVVSHGGTIMAIMERFTENKDFYFWQIRNLSYFEIDFDETKKKILSYKKEDE